LKMVNTKPADHRNQKSPRGSDFLLRCPLPSDKGFLQHVFCIRNASQHPIGNREEQSSILIEYRRSITFVHDLWIIVRLRQLLLLELRTHLDLVAITNNYDRLDMHFVTRLYVAYIFSAFDDPSWRRHSEDSLTNLVSG